jgi:hypothetical protein
MSLNPLIDVLEANRLLRSADEADYFEQALAQSTKIILIQIIFLGYIPLKMIRKRASYMTE